jgi:DNA (cytosine-5)-methyltransferase 1
LESIKRSRFWHFAKRERVIIVGFKKDHPFKFPEKQTIRKRLEELLEPEENVHQKHYISDHIAEKLKQKVDKTFEHATIWHENKSGNIGIHDYSCALRANASHNYLLVNGKRRLTPRENLRLMGFLDSFKIAVSDRAVRKQAGNSVVIPMIQAVAEEMMNALKQHPAINKKFVKNEVKIIDGFKQPSLWGEGHLPLINEYAK